jgi:hypothetical protein
MNVKAERAIRASQQIDSGASEASRKPYDGTESMGGYGTANDRARRRERDVAVCDRLYPVYFRY